MSKKNNQIFKQKNKYYQDIAIDSSTVMFLIGTGLGSGISDNEDMPFAIS